MPGIERLTEFVSIYQGGHHRHDATRRVARWLEIFPPESRGPLADELAHVLESTFLTRDQAAAGVRNWLTSPPTVSGGLVTDWQDATFLRVQTGGGSQTDLLRLIDEQAASLGLESPLTHNGRRLFVYADDVSVHGMRILNDLTPWLTTQAPADSDLLVMLQWQLSDQRAYISKQLNERARGCGKVLRVRWWADQVFAAEDCYKPTALPDDPILTQYLKDNATIRPDLRRTPVAGRWFSSVESRDLLEREFLRAGCEVLAHNPHLSPRRYMRPLGNTVWKGLGVGVPIVTWRNCPNSAPLCLWADGEAPPLFPRAAN